MRILEIAVSPSHASPSHAAQSVRCATGSRDCVVDVFDAVHVDRRLVRSAQARRRNIAAAAARAVRSRDMERPDVVLSWDADGVLTGHALAVTSGVAHVALVGPQVASRCSDPLVRRALQDATELAAHDVETADQIRRSVTGIDIEVVNPGQTEKVIELCSRALRRVQHGRVVFHSPYPLDPEPASASRERPNQMLRALRIIGYEVLRITGNPPDRDLAFADFRDRVRGRQQIAFVYSENSTQPNALATSVRTGIAVFLEARIFAYCHRHGVPIGQFYRDVYWRFPEKQRSVPPVRRALMQLLYRVDLAVLDRSGAHVFVPSLPMVPIIPFDPQRCTALPPGTALRNAATPHRGFHALYVGGVGPGHEIEELLHAVAQVEAMMLTLVVPRQAWEHHGEQLRPLLTDRVNVVHAAASQLGPHYDRASLCLLTVQPNEYRRFAVPMKLYEYLGYGKPVLASSQTLAGEIVEDLGVGCSVHYRSEEIAAALSRLIEHPEELETLAQRARTVREDQTWVSRARTVAASLDVSVSMR